jgi:hypothetical protein
MEAKEKAFILPEEIRKLDDKADANTTMRDLYIKIPFMHKRALKCAENLETYRRQFWDEVLKLYPELENKVLEYRQLRRAVFIKTSE